MSPSEQWVYVAEKIDELRKDSKEERHALRSDMNAGFDKVRLEVQRLREDLTATDKRLLVVETERRSESNVAAKRAAWISVGIGVGWSVLAKLSDWYWKR